MPASSANFAVDISGDPTVYVCAQDRDGAVEGDERLLVLVNAPANGERCAMLLLPQPC